MVDKENRILPDGETGELVIAGLGVGRGYINLPEKQQRFSSLSTEKEPIKQAILQRSLQMARSNFSEELTIRSSFAVSESSLVRSRRLLTASKESSPVLQYRWIINIFAAATLWQTARSMLKRLPLMRQNPWLITWFRMFSSSWKKMPLTQNGKIDKKALPKPVAQPRNLKEPETPMQKKIFDIVAKVVENDFFGIDTSFYKAGLSSISAMKLCVLISEEFGVTVKTSDIHENNTVEKLEKYVMLAPKLRTYEKRERFILLPVPRRGIFAECSKNPESTVYNIPFLF